MNNPLGIALILLSACSPSSPSGPASVVLLPVQVDVADPAKPVDPVPERLIAAAAQAHDDATRYVFSQNSEVEKINALTQLTHDLNVDLTRMAIHRNHGRYRPADVAALRLSLASLHRFLMANGLEANATP